MKHTEGVLEKCERIRKNETRLSGGSRGLSGWRDRCKGRGYRGEVKFNSGHHNTSPRIRTNRQRV